MHRKSVQHGPQLFLRGHHLRQAYCWQTCSKVQPAGALASMLQELKQPEVHNQHLPARCSC